MTMNLTLNLNEAEQARLTNLAGRQGETLEQFIQSVVIKLVRTPTARELRAMPREERDRILAIQAEEAAPLYEADLAKPVAERKLTAFTALDGEPVYDRTP